MSTRYGPAAATMAGERRAFRAKATSAEQLVMVADAALAGYISSVAQPDHSQQPAHKLGPRHAGSLVTVIIEDTR